MAPKDKKEEPKKKEDDGCGAPARKSNADGISASLDACLADGVIKTGSSVLLGGLASLLFFKRRRWPIIAGMGTGIGLAWANCENDLNNSLQTDKKDAKKKK